MSRSPSDVLYRNRLPALGTMAMPTINRILEDAAQRPGTIVERSRGNAGYFFMRCGAPEELDVVRVEQLWRQLQEKNLLRLHTLLEESGALVGQQILFSKLRDDWVDVCFVAHVRHGAGEPETKCSCFFYRWPGHCPHAYPVLSRLGIRLLESATMPAAASAPTLFDDSEASSPAHRRRARRRAKYRPRPVVPPADGAEVEAAPPATRRRARVLHPQRAVRSHPRAT